MTEEQIKEQLSIHFIGALASKSGVKVIRPIDDNGVDVLLKKVMKITLNNKTRIIDSGEIIGVQLKCTTKSRIIKSEIGFSFDLPSKNFNDLVYRNKERLKSKVGNVPLILIILVIPNTETKWLEVNTIEGYIKLGGKAFWYIPIEENFTRNESSKRISFLNESKIDLDFFSNIFNLFYKKNES